MSNKTEHNNQEHSMDEMWGDGSAVSASADADRGKLFREGKYAMFIHWGLYSHIGNQVNGRTYYGIAEWIMNDRMAGIPVDEYMALAEHFNPVAFDAKAIARLAYDAGMKYIVVSSKHHDGFAMYDSACNDFNIVRSTPYALDPMKALSEACRELGLGFGFYYSHNQDWTFPGGGNGPTQNGDGKPATFDDYFAGKCLPQVEEITFNYGPIEVVWFDTPGKMPRKYVEELVAVVRRNQPNALVSGRAGYGLGDYQSLGDMHVPAENVDGLWESCDTTNDSWGYACYDENWKTPREILRRLVATVGRGGTYLLNIGPKADGSVPEPATRALRSAGAWVRRHPQVIYNAGPSPWRHAVPWGDVTVQQTTLSLVVFDWPASGTLSLVGLRSEIASARLLKEGGDMEVEYNRSGDWVRFTLPTVAPDPLASVLEVTLKEAPQVDPLHGIDPETETVLHVDSAVVQNAKRDEHRWMEKFGEWKHVNRVHEWKPDGRVTWEIAVLTPGDYEIDVLCTAADRAVWSVDLGDGNHVENQVTGGGTYTRRDIGWLRFPAEGAYTIHVSCPEGDGSLAGIWFTPVIF